MVVIPYREVGIALTLQQQQQQQQTSTKPCLRSEHESVEHIHFFLSPQAEPETFVEVVHLDVKHGDGRASRSGSGSRGHNARRTTHKMEKGNQVSEESRTWRRQNKTSRCARARCGRRTVREYRMHVCKLTQSFLFCGFVLRLLSHVFHVVERGKRKESKADKALLRREYDIQDVSKIEADA